MYREFDCYQGTMVSGANKKIRAFKVWCSDMPPAAIAYNGTPTDGKTPDPIVDAQLKTKDWEADSLMRVGKIALENMFGEKSKNSTRKQDRQDLFRISVPCEFWFQVKVIEGGAFWDEFWKINDALEFNREISSGWQDRQKCFVESIWQRCPREGTEVGIQSPSRFNSAWRLSCCPPARKTRLACSLPSLVFVA